MPFYDFICSKGHEQRDVFLRLNDPRPACADCGEAVETLWDGKRAAIQDSIEGGLKIEHALLNTDGSPRTFYSHSALRRATKEAGLVNEVYHIPGSPHTSRWL